MYQIMVKTCREMPQALVRHARFSSLGPLVRCARFSLTNARSSSFRQRASSLGDLVLVRLGAKTEVATHWERRLSLVLGNWERGWSCKLVTSGKVHVVFVGFV